MKTVNMAFWREVFEKQIKGVKPGDAWRLVMDQRLDFHYVDTRWRKWLMEHAHARFMCSRCCHSWSSHQAVILFHMHWEQHGRQGQVKMRLFGQKCQKCFSNKYEEPQFSEDDVDNILEDMILEIREKCYGERIDHSKFSKVIVNDSGPHMRGYCEACQLGIHKRLHGQPNYPEHHRELQSKGNLEAIKQTGTPTSTGSYNCCTCFIIIIIIVLFIYYWDNLFSGWQRRW
ncbi:receptor-transporting protein 2-like [Rhineura floridana]|uniref:receptor-transporting protein 2-like n=1 Tax=Rhineura floridana TaxID=261503 RepID=UPI002AC82101|nr:receptor-transporting protein 2-like [Rhineura floridana]